MWLAAAISLALFVLPHVRFFGPDWLLRQGVGVVLLYLLYIWRRNLWATMLMHFLGNAPLLLPAAGVGE
jgi:membrane protease YdiL (CAAX protease family)